MATSAVDLSEDLNCIKQPKIYRIQHDVPIVSKDTASGDIFSSSNVSSKSYVTQVQHTTDPSADIPEEECWLFKIQNASESSKFLTNSSCLQWAREVYDSPTSELYHRRWDLMHRLELILTTEPAKRLPNLGGSVPALNVALNVAATLPLGSKFSGGGSGNNLCPGSSATFKRPQRHGSEVWPQHSRQRSSPNGDRSPLPIKPSGSTDDLQNVNDLRSIALQQENDLKAKVAALSANQQVPRTGGSQQSLNSVNRSGPESPYSSQGRLNVSSSPTPGDIAKQQMIALRLSLDSQKQSLSNHRDSEEDLVSAGGEGHIPYRTFSSPQHSQNTERQFPIDDCHNNCVILPDRQQAVILGRTSKLGTRLPAPIRRHHMERGLKFPSTEMLPSYGWGDSQLPGPAKRSSHEQLVGKRNPVPPPRSASNLTSSEFSR